MTLPVRTVGTIVLNDPTRDPIACIRGLTDEQPGARTTYGNPSPTFRDVITRCTFSLADGVPS